MAFLVNANKERAVKPDGPERREELRSITIGEQNQCLSLLFPSGA